jgi:MFS family permease
VAGVAAAPAEGAANRALGLREGVCLAVMQGAGDNYLSAFAVLLHATPFQIAALAAIPQLAGNSCQLLSVHALSRWPCRKALAVAAVAGQAALWLPLLAMPLLFPAQGAVVLIACAAVLLGVGSISVPPWASLLTDVVDAERRGAYFGRRQRAMTVASFTTLVAAGVVMHLAAIWDLVWAGFAVLFGGAALARAASAWCLYRIDDSAMPTTRHAGLSLTRFLAGPGGRNLRGFLAFSGLMHLAVATGGPFFTMYMLRDLRVSYLEYGAWIAAGALGQFLSLGWWGRIGDRFGNRRLVWLAALMMPWAPMLYTVSTAPAFLICLNGLSGVVWAGLLLGLQNYVFDATRPEDRARGVALWHCSNAVGWFVGAMTGALLAATVPAGISVGGVRTSFASNLALVIFISGALRLAVALAVLPAFAEVRRVRRLVLGRAARAVVRLRVRELRLRHSPRTL